MTSTFFQRLLIIILLAGTVPTLWAQEYKYEIGGMAGGAFYMGDANKNTIFKGIRRWEPCSGITSTFVGP